ncbi:MAG: LapA family protein [Rhodospirillales bacterium]|nr:LapA family protein [Rhodospirillales bacterium]
MTNLKRIISYLLAALVIVFAVQNIATVEVNFLIWSVALPRAIVLFIVFILGVVTGSSLTHEKIFRRTQK